MGASSYWISIVNLIMNITGKKLIELGFEPNKYFGELLTQLNNKALHDEESIREFATSFLAQKKTIEVEPFTVARPFHVNIRATNKVEAENIAIVLRHMEAIMKTPTVIEGALMPDACPTGEASIPVGAVVSTTNAIHPNWHSSDMCCSVMATDLGDVNPADVLLVASNVTQFGKGGRRGYMGFRNLLYDNKELLERIEDNYFTSAYVEKAASHLGTQGDGNHFLYVGRSKNTGSTYLVTHHGSRGFGSSVFKKGMQIAETFRRELSPLTAAQNAWIPFLEKEGQNYWEAIAIVRDWTKLNHSSIHDAIGHKLQRQYLDRFWNEHNSVFKEGEVFYHAKGATPVNDALLSDSSFGRRLIPLNMKEPILVVTGTKNATNLGFAPHGAGRNKSRKEHVASLASKSYQAIFEEETRGIEAIFASGVMDLSELPSAYKDAVTVKSQIEEFNLATVVDEIIPYGCIMAGKIDF